MQSLKPIETVYKGYRFRSRLEARWAVFFDALGVRWEYEKEGYDLGPAGRYLPDFWLPDIDCWVEIKGQHITDKDAMKAAALAEQTGKTVFVFDHPDFERPSFDGSTGHFHGAWGRQFWPEHYDDEGDFGSQFYKCAACGMVGIDKIDCGNYPGGACSSKARNDLHNLAIAYGAARSARFEHGESGTLRVPVPQVSVGRGLTREEARALVAKAFKYPLSRYTPHAHRHLGENDECIDCGWPNPE